MQCKCGGETVERENVREKGRYRLAYSQCTACGRQGSYAFYRDERLVLTGPAAQAAFDDPESLGEQGGLFPTD